ncbi:MAG: hypothetical protein IT356_07965 [Gemmatimonadaceae bacterium]|nr:hypothetical protein [Gemmatimonadaceae bacterium]
MTPPHARRQRLCIHLSRAQAAIALAAAVTVAGAACRDRNPAYPGPYGREVAAAIPKIEKATGLRFKVPPKVEIRDRADLREFLREKFDEEQPALDIAGEEQAYKLLGLLPDTLDLRSFLLSLLSEQVVGYYDPATKVLYVVGGDAGAQPAPDVVQVTITHELVHALQDQYMPLDSLVHASRDNDRVMAVQALVEGYATFEQLNVMLGGGKMLSRLPGGWDRVREMIRDAQGTMPVLGTAPVFIQETLLFPYLSGAEYVRRITELKPGENPLGFVPQSTEQVLHPEKAVAGDDPPLEVVLPRPSGGSVIYENGLGEFETRLVLFQQLKDAATASRGASGWGGDRYMVVNTPRGAGITWLSVWDSQFEAAEFRFVLSQALERRFDLREGSGGVGSVLRYAAKGRAVEVIATTVQGHPAVLYTDVPQGASTRMIELSRVRVAPLRQSGGKE